MGNSLLGLGIAILIGSIGRDKQTFKRARAGQLSSLLVLSMIALLLPALFDSVVGTRPGGSRSILDERLSLSVAVVLVFVYLANLAYTLVTHRDVFAFEEGEEEEDDESAGERRRSAWSMPVSVGVLAAATATTALEAQVIAGALEGGASSLRLSPFFLGVIVLAVVGNAAEYVSAAYFAHRDRMGLAFSITVGSTIQIALLVAPLLVIGSRFSPHPMNLVFSSPLELIAIAAVAFAVNAVAADGETTWFEGVLLLSVYALLGLAFYFV